MKTVLALLLALSSAVIGSVVGRSRRPMGRFSMGQVILIALAAVLVAEGGTIVWVGPPDSVFQPVLGGLVLGFVAGFFSGRKPPPPDQLPPNRPH
ncbi:hypothetical protein [Sulfobacillus harzensis]|uniref:Uncharacterized protein n=1 Tax=Sulfobacillus harzensis TaxID=2729629 RepID=A0A7Y0Q1D1_9FIRM|nr:hypothetical protein [Sulfobacillus harzensis]NMP21215.1 hypothetical protein [Sulfobacillus harzensis]